MDKLKLWYDPEGDYLEISFAGGTGEFRPTDTENVMVKVNDMGQMIGIGVMNVSQLETGPLEVEIPMGELKRLMAQVGVSIA